MLLSKAKGCTRGRERGTGTSVGTFSCCDGGDVRRFRLGSSRKTAVAVLWSKSRKAVGSGQHGFWGSSSASPHVRRALSRHTFACSSLGGSDEAEADWLLEEEEGAKGHFKLKELDKPGAVLTGSNDVGTKAFESAERAISRLREGGGLQLDIFSFGFEASRGKVYIRIDKLDNKFGSPTLDDIGLFSRAYGEALAEDLGEDVSDDIEIEVSSPGAERELRIPGDLDRFSELPLCVEMPKDSFVLEGVEVKKSKNDMHSTLRVVMTTRRVDLDKGEVELAPFKSKRNENAFGRKTWNKIFKSGKTLVLGFDQLKRVNIHLEI